MGVVECIREFNNAIPFEPYEIRMVSGERYRVPHPDFVAISAKGTFVFVVDAKDRPHNLNSILIERASVLTPRKRRRAA